MIKRVIKTKKHLIRAISTVSIGLVLFFIGSNIAPIVQGVQLSLKGLTNGALYTDDVISLSGFAKHAIKLTVNGRELPVTQEGKFEDVIVLLPGYNIITVKAFDKFGNVSEKKYEVIQRNTGMANEAPVINKS